MRNSPPPLRGRSPQRGGRGVIIFITPTPRLRRDPPLKGEGQISRTYPLRRDRPVLRAQRRFTDFCQRRRGRDRFRIEEAMQNGWFA